MVQPYRAPYAAMPWRNMAKAAVYTEAIVMTPRNPPSTNG